eukprot:TRINITY_DN106762_c0_g1_i1.p1 TRINITY_DN106762_c0_g1~~TRINITY_DN106762_c0_g1_i1.p1  ORF type:complete len:648 (-),score=113.57 TRINITY_DN106762_c0_g1_i1:68-2011(-)
MLSLAEPTASARRGLTAWRSLRAPAPSAVPIFVLLPEGTSRSSGSRPAAQDSRLPRVLAVASFTGAVAQRLLVRSRHRSRIESCASDGDSSVQVKEQEKESLDFDLPSREEMSRQEIELLEATGALELARREEAYRARKQYRQKNPSPLDRWSQEMEKTKMDTQRRMLWGDLKRTTRKHRRYRGKQIGEEEAKIKFNRGFPVEDTDEQEMADQRRDREYLDMWRASWPQGENLDPHNPESFGFSFVGIVTGAHGINGEVRVRVDDFICDQGYEPEQHLAHRNFSNWEQSSKRVHLKAPHRRFPRAFRVLSGKRVQRRVFALRLHNIESVEEAVALRGYKVFVLEPPPSAQEKAKQLGDISGDDLYNADTTTFHTRDALELVGAKCTMIIGEVSPETLGEFAAAESPGEAKNILEAAGAELRHFGNLSAVVPDYKIAKRYNARKAAHDLLDITLVDGVQGGKDQYLYEPDPKSPTGKLFNMDEFRSMDPNFERVVYVPFVPDMVARVDADRAGTNVYFTLPKDHIKITSFKCRRRIVDERGLLVIPRGPHITALLPPPGKSHALRRRDGRKLPLHGTAPAPLDDLPQPAGEAFPEPSPGVPRPPLWRPFGGLDRDESSFKKRMKQKIAEERHVVRPIDMDRDETNAAL